MKLLIFTIIIFAAFTSTAQLVNNRSISVSIKNESQSAIENATIELLKDKDSSLVKIAISNNDGAADFENIVSGKYFIRASSVNHVTKYSERFELSNTNLNPNAFSIILSAKAGHLKEVIVEGKKPFIQKLSDRIVVNVDNSIINAGSSAMI